MSTMFRFLPSQNPEVGIKDDAPKSHDGLKSNLVLVDTVVFGDVDSAFEKAPRIIRVDLMNQRLAPAPMEPRAVIGIF